MNSDMYKNLITEATSRPTCDFCHRDKVEWRYKADTFMIPEAKWVSVGDWAACEDCATYIEKNQIDDLAFLLSGLLAAQHKEFMDMSGADKDAFHHIHYFWVRKLFRLFDEHKTGEREKA